MLLKNISELFSLGIYPFGRFFSYSLMIMMLLIFIKFNITLNSLKYIKYDFNWSSQITRVRTKSQQKLWFCTDGIWLACSQTATFNGVF